MLAGMTVFCSLIRTYALLDLKFDFITLKSGKGLAVLQTGYMFGKEIYFLCFLCFTLAACLARKSFFVLLRFSLATCLARKSTFFVSCVSDWLHVWQGNLLCRHGVQVSQLLLHIELESCGHLAAL